MHEADNSSSWVSFCISTYKRPKFLEQQLRCLLEQTFNNFEIVISDNDPDASGKKVIELFSDSRIKYYHNGINLGMISSFNKSIERANSEYIVMVTDDDPIDKHFLTIAYNLWKQYPGLGLYGGMKRNRKLFENVELINKKDFISQILDWRKTQNILWSCCVLEKKSVLESGKMPDYGSPHLADHALLAIVGEKKGAAIINKMYSTLTSHDTNFSKTNLDLYIKGCVGFYDTMCHKMSPDNFSLKQKVVIRHLEGWFISVVSSLKRYYYIIHPDKEKQAEIRAFSRQIAELEFMKGVKLRLFLKTLIFKGKLWFKKNKGGK